MADLDYTIIASGSSGNCVVIENIMIDCGIPYHQLEKYLPKVKCLLITHAHSDHLRIQTLSMIHYKYPRIPIYGNWQVAYYDDYIKIAVPAKPIKVRQWEVLPFEVPHDVPCMGYILWDKSHRILYATDLSEIINPFGYKYDYIFLESNYDQAKVEQIRDQHSGNYSPYDSAHRHLSTQQCKAFYYMNRKSSKSQLIELHKSKRFY